MGIIIRQSIKNTILSYLGVALGFVSTILLFPNILTADQYGLTRVLISLALVSSQFAHMGMKNTIIRYFPYFEHSKNAKARLLTLTVGIPAAGFFLFAVLFFLFKDQLIYYYTDQSALFGDYYLFLLPLVLFVLFYEVLNSFVRALQDSVTGSFVNEVLVRALVIILLIAHHFGLMDFYHFMILFLAIYGVQPVYMVVYLYLRGELAFSLPFREKGKRFAKNMGVYSSYAMLGGLTFLLVGNIDIIMLGSMTNLADTAVYAIAFYVGSVISIPQRSIGKIATPILASFLKNKQYKKIESLYRRTSLTQLIAGSLLLIGIWANMHNLMDLLPEQYHGSQWVIIIIGVAKLFNMATGISGSIILNSKYYRVDLYVSIFLVFLVIVTNYLLIPVYGILGAAIATALSIFANHIIKYIFIWFKFSIQPFRWNTLGVLAISAGCLWMSFQIPYLGSFFIDLIVRSAAIASVFLALILMFNISDDVRQLTKETVRQIKGFINDSRH